MVGYAYSIDYTCGYRYVLIKCYDCDDFSFVTDSMPYCIYRVCRTDGKVRLTYTSELYSGKRLSLKHINRIVNLLTLSEYERDYSSEMEWTITPSGICNRGNVRDFYTAFPMSPYIIEKETSYVNITSVCFKSMLSVLDATFICDILNEALYLSDIYESEPFTICGNQIFCSKYVALLAKKIFSADIFNIRILRYIDKARIRHKPSKRKILKAIESCSFDNSEYSVYDSKNLVIIKRACMEEVLNILKETILKKQSFLRTIRQLRLCIGRALREIKDMSPTFLLISGAERGSDMNYLTFDYLMKIFNFPMSHTKIRTLIRLNKERTRQVKELIPPMALYKGNFYNEKR